MLNQFNINLEREDWPWGTRWVMWLFGRPGWHLVEPVPPSRYYINCRLLKDNNLHFFSRYKFCVKRLLKTIIFDGPRTCARRTVNKDIKVNHLTTIYYCFFMRFREIILFFRYYIGLIYCQCLHACLACVLEISVNYTSKLLWIPEYPLCRRRHHR